MMRKKILLSLPVEVADELDKLSTTTSIPKSTIVTVALQYFIATIKGEEPPQTVTNVIKMIKVVK